VRRALSGRTPADLGRFRPALACSLRGCLGGKALVAA
jgi:hypothetical protein